MLAVSDMPDACPTWRLNIRNPSLGSITSAGKMSLPFATEG